MKNTIETIKVCKKCGEDKPLSEYYKRKGAKDGHRSNCKACVRARQRAYHHENLEESNARSTAYYQKNREVELEKRRAFREANPELIQEKNRAFYERNRERLIACQRTRYYECREEILEQKQVYYEENRDRISEYRKSYYEENKHVFIAGNIRRKRLLADAVQEPYLREDIFERDNWTCGLCQEPIDPELQWPERGSASIDHIVPISLGGDDTPANVQAAHLGCNVGKGNRVELEDLQAA